MGGEGQIHDGKGWGVEAEVVVEGENLDKKMEVAIIRA